DTEGIQREILFKTISLFWVIFSLLFLCVLCGEDCIGCQSSCISNPSRSFGSNHVDFGGMIASASDTVISSSTLTGYIENATAALPLSTSCSSATVPLAPPTKSIRRSVRISPIPSTGPSTFSCNKLQSRESMRPVPILPALSRSRQYQAPPTYIDVSPFREGMASPRSA